MFGLFKTKRNPSKTYRVIKPFELDLYADPMRMGGANTVTIPIGEIVEFRIDKRGWVDGFYAKIIEDLDGYLYLHSQPIMHCLVEIDPDEPQEEIQDNFDNSYNDNSNDNGVLKWSEDEEVEPHNSENVNSIPTQVKQDFEHEESTTRLNPDSIFKTMYMQDLVLYTNYEKQPDGLVYIDSKLNINSSKENLANVMVRVIDELGIDPNQTKTTERNQEIEVEVLINTFVPHRTTLELIVDANDGLMLNISTSLDSDAQRAIPNLDFHLVESILANIGNR